MGLREGKGRGGGEEAIFHISSFDQPHRLPEVTPARLPTGQSLAGAERMFLVHVKSLLLALAETPFIWPTTDSKVCNINIMGDNRLV